MAKGMSNGCTADKPPNPGSMRRTIEARKLSIRSPIIKPNKATSRPSRSLGQVW